MMPASILTLCVIVSAISTGVMAGIYFTFSSFIMRAFDELGPVAATEAMNSINTAILRSGFMVLFFGSTMLCAALVPIALFTENASGRNWLLTAGLIYFFGMFICTAVFNVPLNERLAATLDEDSKRKTWPRYYIPWTRWNHLRTLSSLCTCLISVHWLRVYG